MIRSFYYGLDDGEKTSFNGRDNFQRQSRLVQDGRKFLLRAFFAPEGHHHFQVGQAMRMSNRATRSEHDLDDQHATMLWHRVAASLQNLDGLPIIPVMET